MSEGPQQFLFCCFCSADLLALALRVPITQCLKVPTNFYSAVFVPLFLFCCFCSTVFVPLTLFCWPFCHLGSPLTQCPRVPTNFYSTMTFLHCSHQFLFHCFCSAVFIPLTFLHLQLSGGLHHLVTQYIMRTNIPNIRNPNWSQY